MNKLFPVVLIAMNIGAAIAYIISRDYKHGLYWTASAVLLTTVTF